MHREHPKNTLCVTPEKHEFRELASKASFCHNYLRINPILRDHNYLWINPILRDHMFLLVNTIINTFKEQNRKTFFRTKKLSYCLKLIN